MKTLTKISIGFLALAAVALWFTSCSSEDVASGTNQGNQESILLLSFNTGNMGTRGATTNLTEDEKNINDMTIGIYSSDGQRLRTVQKLTKGSKDDATPGSNKFYIDASGKAVAKIVTTAALTAGDQVLVAANTGSADFSKKGTAAGFKSVEIDATTALTGTSAGTALTAATLPKFSTISGKLTATDNKSEFTTASEIKLKNLVSKISLQSITVEFTNPGPYASATFEPQEMYLESVPAKMQFSETAWIDNLGSDSYLSGKDVGKGFLKVTLSTPSVEGASKVLSSTNKTFTGNEKEDVLYTIPNSNTGANKTVLVIKGQFSGETNPVYYKLPLNVASYDAAGKPSGPVAAGTTAFQIPSGKNIKCNITIKTIGSTDPDAESGPLTATLTVTVDPWDDLTQDTTFE